MTTTSAISEADHSLSQPIPYMQRLRDYYLALGYGNPYQWANHQDVPFTALKKPLNQSKIGLITTSAPYKKGAGEQGPGAPYNAAAKFYQVYAGDTTSIDFLGISHLGYDRKYTSAEDINSFFPLNALTRAKEQGRIREISNRYYGAPTNRSQATTLNQDCLALTDFIKQDEVDVVLLVPN